MTKYKINYQRRNNDDGCWLGAVILVVLFAAWFTHVIVCLKAGAWGFLIAGALFFPIAIIHGAGIWFGIF